MSLILDVIVGLLRLAVACRHSSPHLRVVPARDMLEVTFGRLVAPQTYMPAASIFDHETQLDEPAVFSALEPLIRAVEQALLHNPAASDYLERANMAVQELCTLSSMVQSASLRDLHVQVNNTLVFRYLHYIALGPLSETPVTLLVGAVPQGEPLLALPLNDNPLLNQIEVAYAATDPYPHVRTDYWLRFPPNPNKQRFQGWSTCDIGTQKAIELYRLRIPGERPLMALVSEVMTFPVDITGLGLRVSIHGGAATISGIRTTIRDKLQSGLLVVVRIFEQAGA